jgi:formate-dependent phosphoribosylglycinamide formyltransferase (GAR transformylase)
MTRRNGRRVFAEQVMNYRKKLLLLGATTGYQTRSFAEAAERLGFELVLATDRCHVLDNPWGDGAIALRFEDPEGAANVLAAQARVDGIVAVGDRTTYLAALAAERMGIRYNSPDSAFACRNKFIARERFRAAGLQVPQFYRVPVTDDPHRAAEPTSYPCVLKPLGLSASRGVIRANNPAEFAAAFQRITALLRDPDILRLKEEQDRFIQVESFIEGREFALEGIVTRGNFRILALFDKPDPLDGPYFEETIYVTPSREADETQQNIVRTTESAVKAIGLTHGPVHAEMRVNSRGVWMLEIAARPIGGLCARVLPGLEERILRHAAGEDVGEIALPTRSAGVMMIPIPKEGIYVSTEGLEQARSTSGVEDVIITAKAGQKLIPLPEGASYLGFIFARGSSPDQVELALRAAHDHLRFEIAAALPVV